MNTYDITLSSYKMRDVSENSCSDIQTPQFMSNNLFFFENRAVYERMWKNIVQPDRPQTHTENM
jgi:hypothetical protein